MLLTAPGQEPHLEPFETAFDGARRFLPTSPEYAMKRQIVRGHDRIYQLARSFRDGADELSPRHQPEFTLLEWYRAFATLSEIGNDVAALLRRTASRVTGGTVLGSEGRFVDLARPLRSLRVEEAFAEFAGLSLESYLDERYDAFVREVGAERAGGPGDVVERAHRAFFRVLVDDVEPRLGRGQADLLTHYPAAHAALAERCSRDPRVALRFELFVLGIELANAFQELRDPGEQRARFLDERAERMRHGGRDLPLDEEFLAALGDGLPPTAGIAFGVDRWLLLLSGGQRLEEILPFPHRPAEETRSLS